MKPPPADMAVRKEARATGDSRFHLRRQIDTTVTITLVSNGSWMLMYVKPCAKHFTPTISLLFHSTPMRAPAVFPSSRYRG